MPYIKRAQYDKLVLAGANMANLCFNGKQYSKLPRRYRDAMDESQVAWDRALGEIRHGPIPAPPEGAER